MNERLEKRQPKCIISWTSVPALLLCVWETDPRNDHKHVRLIPTNVQFRAAIFRVKMIREHVIKPPPVNLWPINRWRKYRDYRAPSTSTNALTWNRQIKSKTLLMCRKKWKFFMQTASPSPRLPQSKFHYRKIVFQLNYVNQTIENPMRKRLMFKHLHKKSS